MPKKPKTRWAVQEARLAKVNGGRVQPGSGNGDHSKSDVKLEKFLIEAKCRARPDAQQITIKLEALIKNNMEALICGKYGVLSFELGNKDWYVTDIPPVAWGEI